MAGALLVDRAREHSCLEPSAEGIGLGRLPGAAPERAHRPPPRGHRAALLVLHYRGGEMTAGEIAERFACSWLTTSRTCASWSKPAWFGSKSGRERVYQLNTPQLLEVTSRWLGALSSR